MLPARWHVSCQDAGWVGGGGGGRVGRSQACLACPTSSSTPLCNFPSLTSDAAAGVKNRSRLSKSDGAIIRATRLSGSVKGLVDVLICSKSFPCTPFSSCYCVARCNIICLRGEKTSLVLWKIMDFCISDRSSQGNLTLTAPIWIFSGMKLTFPQLSKYKLKNTMIQIQLLIMCYISLS